MPETLVRLDPALPPDRLWTDAARRGAEWAAASGLALRDAIVLLPQAAWLAPCRRAFAAAGAWMPRIETPATLAAAQGAPLPQEPGRLSFDAAFDRLQAAELVANQAWARAWSRRDPHGFDVALARLVDTAHALARAAAAVPPSAREAWWRLARERLAPGGGPGGTERLLARVALEWAALGAEPDTDRLYALRPAGWIVVQAVGTVPLLDAVVRAADVPVLRLDADAGVPDAPGADVRLHAAADFEAEAQATAAALLGHVLDGRQPVALIAQDRLLVRRVRALLARQGVPLADETGWTLSTTRAAGTVMAALRAARAVASTDDVLDWLKTGTPSPAVDALEREIRRCAWTSPHQVQPGTLGLDAAQAWHDARVALSAFGEGRRRTLAEWHAALAVLLAGRDLAADAAGAQVLRVLEGAARPFASRLDLDGFTAWVDAALESASFVPDEAAAQAAVVVTPLARAILRPFAAVVMPGCDERRLGAPPAPQPLLGDALAVELGVPGIEHARQAEKLAFAQLARVPRLDLLQRRLDDDEPLAPSPLLERLRLARERAGRATPEVAVVMPLRRVEPQGLARPAPAPRHVPARLTMSQVEALRECPYRFHSRAILGLSEPEELDDQPDKRDFGTWLHAVLLEFHRTRTPDAPEREVARLLAIAASRRDEAGLDEAAFLPFEAGLEPFAQRYVAWQHARDAQGLAWVDGEAGRTRALPAPAGVELHGRIDRIDTDADGTQWLLDYKTGSLQSLRDRVRRPLEDTQLALYAFLEGAADTPAPALRAAYVALDERNGIASVEHADVAATAVCAVPALAAELARVRDGAPLPPLGEGSVCDRCEARGLCRKDDWT